MKGARAAGRNRFAARRAPRFFAALAGLAAAAAGLPYFPAALAHDNARFYRGEIVAPASWEGVIRLTGTVVIREGAAVSVEPGTQILVQPGVGAAIVVRGRFFVRGVPSKPVVFDSAGGCGAGTWVGIVFDPGAAGVLEHARVRCAEKGIGGDLSRVTKRGTEVAPLWR